MSARLILHPKAGDFTPDVANEVTAALQRCGFIGEPFSPAGEKNEVQHYLIGEHFLQLVTFMGCAPAIELSPPAGGSLDFCHVGISPLYAQPRFLFDAVLATPRCPHCRKVIRDWQSQAGHWQSGALSAFACADCGESLLAHQLNWRRAGGFARLHVSVFGIYPREAIPTDPLLKALAATTDGDWDYFYAR